ncbi:MAG: hypothetical protein OEY64_09670 [Nitrospinota bacterium]|nr:hypothetical protein [Nitrospinota bacterium]
MRKLIPLAIFSMAFALIEAAVVVYLRELYYPHGFGFPLAPLPGEKVYVEIIREGATLAVLASVSFLSAGDRGRRVCYFIFSFGLWDIFYYVWLKIFLDWPATLLAPDILFLIPVIWWGPVLAPVIVAATISVASLLFLNKLETGSAPKIKTRHLIMVLFAASVILYTFMADAYILESGKMPPPFRWFAFAAGELLALGALADMFFMEKK